MVVSAAHAVGGGGTGVGHDEDTQTFHTALIKPVFMGSEDLSPGR